MSSKDVLTRRMLTEGLSMDESGGRQAVYGMYSCVSSLRNKPILIKF